MEIPDEFLPKLTHDYDGRPKLPATAGWLRPIKDITDPAEKALRYYNQALGSLALAKYWIDKDDQNV